MKWKIIKVHTCKEHINLKGTERCAIVLLAWESGSFAWYLQIKLYQKEGLSEGFKIFYCPFCGQKLEEVRKIEFISIKEMPNDAKLYIKKPIPIRAIRMDKKFSVKTMEGILNGKANDYLIQGIKGELYPCNKKIFEESYTELKNEPS